jgi:tetratricopeptide (TPR) repeat protein
MLESESRCRSTRRAGASSILWTGELRVPEPTERERVAIRLLPLGSKKWWSDDRIEKFIADTAARAKEQIAGDNEKQVPDFGRYIKEWAIQYGFSAAEARAEIERWVSAIQEKQDDFYKLGLAAFAEKNFGKAEQLFRESAALNADRMRASKRRIEVEKQRFENYREATIGDYRLAGDSAYNDYAFTKALDAYEAALSLTDQDHRPRQWAEVTMDVAKANMQIGVRTEGPAVQKRLAQAVAAYRAALEVYTRELLPQQWAMTQNNLGTALSDQGTRNGGEEGRRLLAQAVAAYRAALEVYTLEHTGWYWEHTQRNLLRVLSDLEDAPGMAAVFEELLRADRDNADIYSAAQSLYHEVTFDFPAAHRVTAAWLSRHPDDLSARCNLAETLLTTGQLMEARELLAALIPKNPEGDGSENSAHAELPIGTEVALRLLHIVTLTGLGETDLAAVGRGELKALLTTQPEDFQVGWSFDGSEHFISSHPAFAAHRDELLALLQAAGKGRDHLLGLLK